MRSDLDALNIVDLQGFLVLLCNLILEYRPGRDEGEVLAEAFKIMLCEDGQHDVQKAAAFVKLLVTFSVFRISRIHGCFGKVEVFLQKNVKCWNLLENDAGGGSVSVSTAQALSLGRVTQSKIRQQKIKSKDKKGSSKVAGIERSLYTSSADEDELRKKLGLTQWICTFWLLARR
ncbi:hypothetical protein GH714_039542 [Hevea brasiliensis]|uniref:Uncharacterized protein n=1 Tax=Hevea brasiliensis TaxID=3981 RepID=A0A6A6MYL6_HEVBR|nr:hypothetical protein GH714_039542 [Hevea brasiliensis]